MLLDRSGAKFWQRIVFGGLAAIFATSFVIGGVGSGTNFSISDIFNTGGGTASTVPSNVSKAQKATVAHPKDPRAWAGYGQALQGDGRLSPAIKAYKKAIALAPDNLEYRQTLASYYSGQASTAAQQAQNLQLEAYSLQQQTSSAQPFNGLPGSQLPTLVQGQIDQSQTAQINDQASKLQSRAQVFSAQATSSYEQALTQYKFVTTKKPDDPSGWYNYGLIARQANKTGEAVTALKRFLALAPDAPESPGVKALLKQLAPPKASKSSVTSTT